MKTCESVAKIDDQITKIIQNILPTIIQEINKHFQNEYALGEDSGEQSEELNTSYVNINQISSSHAIENRKTVLEKEDIGVEERLKRKRCASPVSREHRTMEDRGMCGWQKRFSQLKTSSTDKSSKLTFREWERSLSRSPIDIEKYGEISIEFFCSISKKFMCDPVKIPSSHLTYDQDSVKHRYRPANRVPDLRTRKIMDVWFSQYQNDPPVDNISTRGFLVGSAISIVRPFDFEEELRDAKILSANRLLRISTDTIRTMEKLAAKKWRETLKSVVEAVLVLRTASTRAFDTEVEGTGNDVGFIVDKQREIILTNCSVVKPGPVVGEATFHNREEIPVYPPYRDPVHDFGFFRFDPAALQFMKCEEIPLAPEAATVGLEIRVVGNDGGENLSIMEGTLSRLDRKAPYNGKDGYNDFNTFYMQAASRIKGGSRGSPVIDCDGQAIGLNVGNKKENSAAFFLPLDRVVRALRFIQKFYDTSSAGSVHIIPRGTLEMTLVHKGFDEARRLGLQRETEQFVRQAFPGGTGVLVIDSVVPEGPAHKMHLEARDLLVRVNGEIVTHFLKLETVLDDNAGKRIDLEVERGGVPVKVSLDVEDLHSITPHYFLEVSGGVIHPLSYQQARNFRLECGLVYVAEPGYMLSRAGVPRHAIIQKLARKKITGVEDFISILSNFSRGAQVPLEFVRHVDRHRPKSVLVTVDRDEWFVEPQFYTRDDVTGLWKSRPALISSFASSSSRGNSSQVIDENISDSDLDNSDSDFESFLSKCSVDSPESVIEAALVMVEVDIPSSAFIDGVHTEHLSGTGVVIHHSKTMGIVAVDKNTVPIFVSDVTLQFAAYPMAIPGQVVFLHPVHNYALVAYDPAALGPSGAATVRAAELAPEPALRNGDVVNLVYIEALDNAFMFIYNQEIGGRTSAKFLATFYDNLLRTHGGNIWKAVELDTSLFNYLGDKRSLEDFCIKKLADRLLDKCSTIDNENKLLSHLKRELGQNFISRMESMLEDFVIADCGHLTRLVKKKDRSNRLCIDYRWVNQTTIKDEFSTPKRLDARNYKLFLLENFILESSRKG